MDKEYEMLQQSLRNRERAWDDFDGDPGGDGTYSELDREGLIGLINLFRARVQVVELENIKLKLEAYKND